LAATRCRPIIRLAAKAPRLHGPLSSNVRQRKASSRPIVSPHVHRFESAASAQTLAEGLAEYYAANPRLKRGTSLSPEAQQFFSCHDVAHVLYGCSTSIPDEAIVKLASIFGTTGGLSVLQGYRLHESLDIYRKLPLWNTALALLLSPYLIVRTVWRCKRQNEPWPWQQHEHLVKVPLRELRARFGIRVAHGHTVSAA
jgi:hypothetical protein